MKTCNFSRIAALMQEGNPSERSRTMVLKAIGKYIDTLPIHDLLRQEEQLADDVTIEIDRFYGRHDLAEFRFFMRGCCI